MKATIICIFSALLFLSFRATAATYDWTGAVSTDWTNRNNWRVAGAVPAAVPTSTDIVFIGNSTTVVTGSGANTGLSGTSFVSYPSVLSGSTATCASLTFGTAKIVTLTVDGTLNIIGDLTQKLNVTSITNLTPTLAGAGTINCTNLVNGDGTVAPATPIIGLSSNSYYTIFTSRVATLNLSNNLKMNTTSSTAIITFLANYNVANPQFFLDGGTMTIGGSIATTNSAYVNATTPTGTNIRNVAEFYIMANSANSFVYFNGATPLAFDASGAGGADFYNAGTYTSNVIYNCPTAQTVYTSSQSRFGVQPANYQNIKFSNTGVKNIQSGAITIAGNWDSAGGKVDAVTLNPTVTFQGTTQTLTDAGSDGGIGVTFKNVLFTGGGTKTISTGNFNIATTGILTMAGSSTLNANGKLTLFSNATSSASIDAIPTGSSITNNVSVQRYLIGGNTTVSGQYTARGYRMLSSPVHYGTGTGFITPSYLSNSALTGGTGGTAGGFTVLNNNPSIYLYREDAIPSNTTFNSGKHKGITYFNADNTVNVFGVTGSVSIPAGNGYIFYYVGNNSNPITKTKTPFAAPESTTTTATGLLNQGDIPVNLWYTPAGATAPVANKLSFSSAFGTSAGYNMVGNPYASTLDLSKVLTDNPTLSNTVYVMYNVNPGQKYIAYNKGGSSDPNASQYVVSGQGFIVQAKAANATLTFHESEKAATTQLTGPTLLMGMPVVEQNAVVGLYMKMERDSIINDYCGVYFTGNSSANYDEEDAKDLDGASSAVYMSSYTADGIRTAINHMPDYKKGSAVKLYVNAAADGLYKLKTEGIRNIDTTVYDIWLKDRFIKDSLNIGRYKEYNFRLTRSDTTSYGANRFQLVIRRKPLPPYQLIDFTAQKATDAIIIKWKTYNEGNFTGFQLEKLQAGNSTYEPIFSLQSNSSSTYNYTDKAFINGPNTYRLKQFDIDDKVSYSAAVTVNTQTLLPGNSLITIYPNPVAETLSVNINLIQQATTNAKIFNNTGVLMMQKTIQGNSWQQYVGQLKPGVYIIELSKNNGSMIARSKFIKN